MEELRKVCNHPSADEIYTLVRKRLPRISLGTVYRNLEVLASLGEIQKLELAGTLKRFDGDPKPHYHMRCLDCDRVEDAPVMPLPNLEAALEGRTSYQVTGHRIEFTGRCPHCSKSKPH